MTKSDAIDALTSLAGPDDDAHRLVPSGTARARFERQTSRSTEQDLSARAALHDLPSELVFLASDLAALATDCDHADRDALRHLFLAVLLAHEEGSTRVAVLGEGGRHTLDRIFTTLAGPKTDRTTLIRRIQHIIEDDIVPSLIGHADAYTPLIREGDHLYLQRLVFLERRFSANFRRRQAHAPSFPDPTLIVRQLAARGDIPLNDEQQTAVIRAASQPFTIVAGGPGTGKTSIVLALLETLDQLGVPLDRVAVAAPTGKATNRLRESIERSPRLAERCPEPRTLHRLLGYVPINDSFRHHENNRLADDVVIVDESSMIDLALMERLLRALPDHGRLVLLGDAEQLPSVEAGTVLRDLVAADPAHTVRLTESHRMRDDDPAGRAILRFAAGVNEGRIEGDVGDGVRIIDVRSPVARTAFLARWYEQRIAGDAELDRAAHRPYPFLAGSFREQDHVRLEAVFDHHARAKLLCITRHKTYTTGANAINEALHQKVVLERGLVTQDDWLPGEPIIMLRNDYERGLFNGDQGVVLMVGVDQDVVRPSAVFRTARGLEAFPIAQLEHRIERSYAMTVHKAQGSELDHVGVVLPEIDVPLLTREILYTAVTRARSSVTIVGHPDLLTRAVLRPMQRDSGLAERLRAPDEP